MAGGGGNIAEILRKYTTSIKALAKKVCLRFPNFWLLQGSVTYPISPRKRTFDNFGNYIPLEYIDQGPKIHMVVKRLSNKAKIIVVPWETVSIYIISETS